MQSAATALIRHITLPEPLEAFGRAEFDTLLAAWRAAVEHDPRSLVAVPMPP